MKRVSIPSGPRRGPQQPIQGVPTDFGRLSSMSRLENAAWAEIPTFYYDFNRFELPLTDEEADENFGMNIPVFNDANPSTRTRQTNAAVGSGVNEPFAALGAGIIAMGEGEAFSMFGVTVPTPVAETFTPVVFSHPINLSGTDCYCGAADLSAQPETTRQATLWWGAPTWRFIEKFFQAYRLQIRLSSRFLVVDESLFDIGMSPVPPEFVGASNSKIPTMPFINAVNDVMLRKDMGQQFLAANSIVQTGNVGQQEQTFSFCLPPPLAEVTYGHPRITGLANRIYCFNQPLLLVPGLRFEVDFVNVEDLSVYAALRNTITLNCTTQGARFRGDVAFALAPEISLFETCGINCTVPGGSVSLGVVFKGCALWPKGVVDYFTRYLGGPQTAQAQMYMQAPDYLTSLLRDPELDMSCKNEMCNMLGMTPDKVVLK